MEQAIYFGHESVGRLREIVAQHGFSRSMLVCGRSFEHLPIRRQIESLPVKLVRFSGFSPNPKYEEVSAAVELFRSERCDSILAVGGGSAIDVAKCVKIYCQMDPGQNYLEQEPFDTGVPLIAIPTTAGTGSESTHFAVIYYQGVKQSVSHESIRPDHVVLEPAVLEMLPLYQKKCTMMDALCQGIESWWSVNSTEESIDYARRAVRAIRENWQAYIIDANTSAAAEVMKAANYAGRAIDITQTTAPHAMSYKLTSLYGLPHGYAVAVCLPEVWEYMLTHMEMTVDERGASYLQGVFRDMAAGLNCADVSEAIQWFRSLMRALGMSAPEGTGKLDELTAAVNPVRLKNNPVRLGDDAIRDIYERILMK